MHKAAHMKQLWVWVALLIKSVEMTEMYSVFVNKLFILNKMWITNFLIGELVALFHLFLFQKGRPAFVWDQQLCIYFMFPSEKYF